MITIKELPYPPHSLEPYISIETIKYHWGRHYKGYVDNVNNILKDIDPSNSVNSLQDIIHASKGKLYNNSCQVWNHEFYFDQFSQNPHPIPADLMMLIEDSFGDFSNFKKLFIESATSIFGSGWCWLCIDKYGGLHIENTMGGDHPSIKPILVVDMWEHAYYIDYKNDKKKYLENIFNIIDWDVVVNRI